MKVMALKIFGGCCGTTPEFIKCLSDMLHKEGNLAKEPVKMPSAVCSATSTVIVDQPRVVGERINPTGKKVFKQALLDNDMDYILGQALEQTGAGADILDVNVGLPGIDERQMMVDTVKALQSVVDVPLQLDSTIPEVLDAALRVYNGKPIVNSVNGEEDSLNNILPIVKKYGAAVIGLALDKDGIPKKAEDRVAIARKIMDRAIRLADINNPESRDIERVMNAEGLYEQLKNINWFDLLQEMSENSEYYSFKGVFHALSGATPEGYGPISGRRVR